MRKSLITILGCIFLFVSLAGAVPAASDQNSKEINKLKELCPKIFLDCSYCDTDYIRKNITFINYVWERNEADVHVLITTRSAGSGGTEYTLAFIGQGDYANFQNTLRYETDRDDSEDERRKGLVKILKLGLVSVVARTPFSAQLKVSQIQKASAVDLKDKWNFWVFSVGLNSFFNGESTYNSLNLGLNLSANRITNQSKLRMGFYYNYDESRFDYEDTTIISTADSKSFTGLYVKSFGEHWSAGLKINVSSSTFSNNKLRIHPAPAIEYNVFKYSDSTRKQLCFLYSLGYSYASYHEETIYDKTAEHLIKQSLVVSLELKEPWGSVETELSASQYFHDLSKYRLQLSADFNLRLVKGLSINFFGRFSKINDQLSLPKEGATLEEVLLRRRELETSYNFFGFISLNYRFGSKTRNVVNPRFGEYHWL